MANYQILVIRLTGQSESASMACHGACLKWMLPELSFSDRWSRGMKLWERDWHFTHSPILRLQKLSNIFKGAARSALEHLTVLAEETVYKQ